MMPSSPSDQTPTQVNAAAAAYRRRGLTPKQMEAEVFARATRAIRAAEASGPLDHARAIADNRRLWDAVHGLVIDPANALPADLRARIAGVALAVLRECDAQQPDLGFIAEVNDQFAAALWR
jgi:flagellar biosynthesis regulator FlaF